MCRVAQVENPTTTLGKGAISSRGGLFSLGQRLKHVHSPVAFGYSCGKCPCWSRHADGRDDQMADLFTLVGVVVGLYAALYGAGYGAAWLASIFRTMADWE